MRALNEESDYRCLWSSGSEIIELFFMSWKHSLFLVVPIVSFAIALRPIPAQPPPQYPTIDPVTHRSYTETIERDGVKASFELTPIPGATFLMASPPAPKAPKQHAAPPHPVS